MSISAEKLSHLKGVIDGLNLSESTSAGKLFLEIVDVLSALSSEKEQLDSRVEKLGQYVDDLDRSLTELCDSLYEDNSSDEQNTDKEEETDKVSKKQTISYDVDDNDADDDDFDDSENGVSYYSVVCPYCESYVTLTGDLLPEKGEGFECPSCGKLLFRK